MCSRPAQEPAVDGGIAVSNGHSTGNLDAASVEIECPPRGHVAADEKLSAVVEGDQAGGIVGNLACDRQRCRGRGTNCGAGAEDNRSGKSVISLKIENRALPAYALPIELDSTAGAGGDVVLELECSAAGDDCCSCGSQS